MIAKELLPADFAEREGKSPSRFLIFCLLASLATISLGALGLLIRQSLGPGSPTFNADAVDARLQRAAKLALGDRRGSIIVMDPQTGRVRAVVNPSLAFEQSFRPGSTIKPFTTLTALRAGLLTEDSHKLCHETYAHDEFQTTCSHPRDLPPLNPSDALAYSCNYFFGTLGERIDETNFRRTLSDFGFGKKTGINADESAGKLTRVEWRSQNAIGEGNNLEVTPLQVINAYSALVNGGSLNVPRFSSATAFVPQLQTRIALDRNERNLIMKGMRGAVRYGTAETAHLYSLPVYIFGKTGTATEINGFRTQGWFIGFASQSGPNEESESAPENIRLAVLVFLSKAHGSDASEIARPVFEEYARLIGEEDQKSNQPKAANSVRVESDQLTSSRLDSGATPVRVHQVRENVTRAMSIEDYVLGVVAAEGSTETEPEALKALAIASRTYTLKNMNRHAAEGYDFCTTTHCQRYRAVNTGGASYISPLVGDAVAETRGEVLRDASDELVASYFSASCGGATANIRTLWGGTSPSYLEGVNDEYCAHGHRQTWTDVLSTAQLVKAFQSDERTNVGPGLRSIAVTRRDDSGRAAMISIAGDRQVTVKGWDFKIIVGRALGWNLLKSSRFEIVHSGSNYVFKGSGFGHGLGLCQEGAHVMAKRGANYRTILAKYFPSTHVAGPANVKMAALDLIWTPAPLFSTLPLSSFPSGGAARQSLSSENFRINYPASLNRREVEFLLGLLQSARGSLIRRVGTAGVSSSLPTLDVYLNETTGDFVGRTGQPPWVAAATKGSRIDLQPIAILRRRQILETTLRHELVHVLVDSLGRGRSPRWLAEGLAIYYAGESRMVTRYEPREKLTTEEIERRLGQASSQDEMRAAYAAAYSEVKRLISKEGEKGVWRRVAG